jgi:hypothetical protein
MIKINSSAITITIYQYNIDYNIIVKYDGSNTKIATNELISSNYKNCRILVVIIYILYFLLNYKFIKKKKKGFVKSMKYAHKSS